MLQKPLSRNYICLRLYSHSAKTKQTNFQYGVDRECASLNVKGAPQRGTRNPALTQVFRTNHAQKLPEIHVHAKFTQSCWMPD